MKKIFTLFAALAMVMSMSAATKTIYCKMAQNWWKSDGAAVGAYAWKDGGANNAAWPGVRMTKVAGETDLWSIDIDASKFNKIVFTRVNGSGTVADWGAKTADQNIPTDDKNLFTITSSSAVWGDPGCTGTWSIYAPDAPKTYKDITITVTANAAASIKWSDAGDKLANATAYVAMTAGENNTYSYTLAQVDEASGVNFTIKVGDIESASKNTNTNFTADFKELMKKVVVKGVNSWEDKDIMTVSDDYLTASITLPLVVKKYDLKLTVDGAWKGHKNENNITRAKNSSVFKNDDGNGSITADIAGDYVFTYTYANQTLTVTYPALPVKYNVTVTAENGTVTGAGEYEEGKEATLTATAAEGYQFVNWTKGEEVVSTENPYSFTVTADVALVANFELIPPTKYNVNVTAENGTVTGAGEYEEGATATLTADPAEGYEFTCWTAGKDTVSTANPYTFTVSADVALVANFKEAEPVYQVIEDEITNFVFDTEAWPMVCQGGPSANYQIEVFLVLTEDADGTLSYEDCSVSIMGTDATFIEGTLSDLDVYAPSADAVLRVQWNGEFYELHLAMSAAAAAEPTNVLVTNAVKSYDEGSGALKLTGRWEGVEVFVEIGGYEGKESIEYSTPQGVLFETPDVAAFGNEASIIVAGEDITVVCNGLKPNMGNDVYNVTITTLSEVSTALDNLNTTVAPVKMIENGQLIIINNGVQYNAQGAILK